MTSFLDLDRWQYVPPHFWTVCWFILGSMVGSFLNVCIYRMPRDLSVVHPPSHCPNCEYRIPWYLNMPLITWLVLRGKCAHCKVPISFRYFAVELLTGLLFLATWLLIGPESTVLAMAYATILSGFLVATMIDFEHFIIPDQVTLGGIGAGLVFSLAVPALHMADDRATSMERSAIGAVVGLVLVYAVVRLGKLMFGKMHIKLPDSAKLIFTETELVLPDESVPYEELFYRKSDSIRFHAEKLELVDRCYAGVQVRLSPNKLYIEKETFDPEKVGHMEAICHSITLPREAMGLGDVKFMGAIGAFLGWQSTIFSLMISSMIGAVIGVGLILIGRRDWSSRLPFGPYIALAAVVWMFMPGAWQSIWLDHLNTLVDTMRPQGGL
jgi:leader peptidase (prepilin peptidase) / N-methyltransferase